MREDGGAILGADVVPLAIELGGVVSGEEDGEDVVIGDDIGIEGQQHGFGVAGVAAANLLVAGIGEDRKDVGEGRSVAVRVDLGGSRIIKKQVQRVLIYIV